jgi:hypothetical protein
MLFFPLSFHDLETICFKFDFHSKSDNIVANGVYTRVFATNLDISEIETLNIQFEKKPKSFFSWTDENSQTLAIDKLIIQSAETEDL